MKKWPLIPDLKKLYLREIKDKRGDALAYLEASSFSPEERLFFLEALLNSSLSDLYWGTSNIRLGAQRVNLIHFLNNVQRCLEEENLALAVFSLLKTNWEHVLYVSSRSSGTFQQLLGVLTYFALHEQTQKLTILLLLSPINHLGESLVRYLLPTQENVPAKRLEDYFYFLNNLISFKAITTEDAYNHFTSLTNNEGHQSFTVNFLEGKGGFIEIENACRHSAHTNFFTEPLSDNESDSSVASVITTSSTSEIVSADATLDVNLNEKPVRPIIKM